MIKSTDAEQPCHDNASMPWPLDHLTMYPDPTSTCDYPHVVLELGENTEPD